MILYNPAAGKEDIRKKELISLVAEAGYSCGYSSTKKKDWTNIDEETDFLVVAGGDGTVSKVADFLLSRTLKERKYPIALLPMGTANNIANMLGLGNDMKKITASWKQEILQTFDAGIITNLPDTHFFLEAIGIGVFPKLISVMQDVDKETLASPEEELKHALTLLHEIIHFYEPGYCRIMLDGVDYSGGYLLIEIMNISSIGPQLLLNPDAVVSDGKFEVIMIKESDREKLADFVQDIINTGTGKTQWIQTVQASSIRIQFEGDDVHADDQLVSMQKNEEVRIDVQQGVLDFLVRS